MRENLDWNKIKKPVSVSYDMAINDSYFFCEQARAIERHCKSFLPTADLDNFESEESQHRILHNQVISIVGDRGTGKSSLLETSRAILNHAHYYVLDTIDPSTFNNSMNVTELLLSKCYKVLKDQAATLSNSREYESLKQELYTQLKKSLTVLNNLRLTKTTYIENSMTHEVLEDYMERESFAYTLQSVLNLVLKVVNATLKNDSAKFLKVALLIDDLDLVDNQEIYNMTEDIRKYLATSVVVVIAYRETQLQNAILQTLVEKSKSLLDQKLIMKDELKDQAAKYLEKLAPYATRVFMPVEEELYAAKLKDIVSVIINDASSDEKQKIIKEMFIDAYGVSSEISLKDWFFSALGLKIKLDLRPLDEKENTHSQFPNNLRGVLDFIKIIHTDMYPTTTCTDSRDIAQKVLLNIKLYRTYFRSFCNQILEYDQYGILRNWETATIQNKNFTIYFDLWNRYFKDTTPEFWENRANTSVKSKASSNINNEITVPLDVLKVQPANVALADVSILLDDAKTLASKSFNELNFIYAIKVFYSLNLTELFLEAYLHYDAHDTDYNQSLEQYLTLLNSYIIPKYAIRDVEAQYHVSWLFAFDKSHYINSATPGYKQFVDLIVYTTIPEGGDVMPAVRARINQPNRSNSQRSYRFRNAFSHDTIDFTDGDLFPRRTFKLQYDFFAFLGKKSYIETVFKSFSHDNCERKYALTSMFDIDKFIFMNYVRRSQSDPIEYFIRCIDRGLHGEFQKPIQLLLNRKLIEKTYHSEESHIYQKIFKDIEIPTDFNDFDTNLIARREEKEENIDVATLTKEQYNAEKKIVVFAIVNQYLLSRNDLSQEDRDYIDETLKMNAFRTKRKNDLWNLLLKYKVVPQVDDESNRPTV